MENKRKQLIVLIIMICILSGCNNHTDGMPIENESNNEYTYESDVTESEEVSNDDIQSVPSHITELFEQYDNILSQGQYDIMIGEEIGIDDRDEEWTYYRISLCPSDPNMISYPYVQFMGNNDYVNKSFSVYILDDCTNTTKKEIIYCTLLATNPHESDEKIASLLNELVDSYDGYSQSDVVELGNYRYYLDSSAVSADEILEVVSKEEINLSIDKTEYREYGFEEMQAELNQGEKVMLTSEVVGIYEDDYNNYLLVGEGEEIYYIHYSPELYVGIFEEGKEYTFYGEIASPCKSYIACVSLEYAE
ncbi:MAG: hypothetical protein IJD40_10885 [Lachnospiraceae bacterium]|nr:hypothetical protein [Lachnospiraceae bacterium]